MLNLFGYAHTPPLSRLQLTKTYIHCHFCSLFAMLFYVCSLHNITADYDRTAARKFSLVQNIGFFGLSLVFSIHR